MKLLIKKKKNRAFNKGIYSSRVLWALSSSNGRHYFSISCLLEVFCGSTGSDGLIESGLKWEPLSFSILEEQWATYFLIFQKVLKRILMIWFWIMMPQNSSFINLHANLNYNPCWKSVILHIMLFIKVYYILWSVVQYVFYNISYIILWYISYSVANKRVLYSVVYESVPHLQTMRSHNHRVYQHFKSTLNM